MTQDFAKIKPEPLLERKTVATPPAWSLMFSGIIVGVALGVFGCFLFYLSGNVPPLNVNTGGDPTPPSNQAATVVATEEPVEEELQLEFYTELRDYEVPVEGNPVELTEQQAAILEPRPLDAAPQQAVAVAEEQLDPGFILQSGAFQQAESARAESERQKLLGLDVNVKQQELLGRTLYLIQSGPYVSSTILAEAEQILRANNIPNLRMTIQ